MIWKNIYELKKIKRVKAKVHKTQAEYLGHYLTMCSMIKDSH